MASKRVLVLLSTERHSYPLLRYLTAEGKTFGWKIRIGCVFDNGMVGRLGKETFALQPDIFHIAKMPECEQAIKKSDLVIGMTTDILLLQVADACIRYRKSLIAPSALNRQMVARKAAAKENNVLLLMDCGFSPGLDHITAKKAIDNIHAKGGKITSFRTYSGSFVIDDASGNPWGVKLAEPVSELLNLGRQNNRFLLGGQLQHIPYHRLFERTESIGSDHMENTVAIHAGDSLYYRKVYGLSNAHTVIKGKLMPREFAHTWDILVRLGLTDSTSRIDFSGDGTPQNILAAFVPYSDSSLEERLQQYGRASRDDIERLRWLGLFDASIPEEGVDLTPATILQQLLEDKLSPLTDDHDHVIMEHQLSYEFREECYAFKATLVSRGEKLRDGALAKAVGLTCGIAAKSFLLGSITVRGLHTPVIREIYDPILNELSDLGLAFHVEEKKLGEAEPALS